MINPINMVHSVVKEEISHHEGFAKSDMHRVMLKSHNHFQKDSNRDLNKWSGAICIYRDNWICLQRICIFKG